MLLRDKTQQKYRVKIRLCMLLQQSKIILRYELLLEHELVSDMILLAQTYKFMERRHDSEKLQKRGKQSEKNSWEKTWWL